MKLAALLVVALPAVAFAQDRPVVIKADTVIDGKGATLTNTNTSSSEDRRSRRSIRRRKASPTTCAV